MRRFDFYRPSTLDEAFAVLRERGEGGMILAGGTDLLVQAKEGHRRPAYVVSLNGIAGLDRLEFKEPDGLRIGARVLMQAVADDPLVQQRFSALADGAGIVGSYQTRHLATVGGNVCNAAPSADTSPPLAVLDATVHIAGTASRTVPVAEFWTGPGHTELLPGEIVTHISVPATLPASGSHYQRHTPRKEMDIAAVGTAVYLELDAAGLCTRVRIALGAVAPKVIRAPQAEAALVGQPIDDKTAADAGRIAATEATPISDQRGSADFRRYLVEVMTKQSVLRAAERARGG
jgi:carbon-monoxide dehydrogenase medium subunit